MTTGQKIRMRMAELNMKPCHVQKEAGIDYRSLYRWKNDQNRISLGEAARIAKALKVPVDYLVADDEEEGVPNV